MDTLAAGSQYTFTLTAINPNGSNYDLTGCTVNFLLRDSLGNVTTHLATLVGSPNNVAIYQNALGDLVVPSSFREVVYTRSWEINNAGVILISLPIIFKVDASP